MLMVAKWKVEAGKSVRQARWPVVGFRQLVREAAAHCHCGSLGWQVQLPCPSKSGTQKTGRPWSHQPLAQSGTLGTQI